MFRRDSNYIITWTLRRGHLHRTVIETGEPRATWLIDSRSPWSSDNPYHAHDRISVLRSDPCSGVALLRQNTPKRAWCRNLSCNRRTHCNGPNIFVRTGVSTRVETSSKDLKMYFILDASEKYKVILQLRVATFKINKIMLIRRVFAWNERIRQ